MTASLIKRALESLDVPGALAEDIVARFSDILSEVRQGQFRKASAGQFVEGICQALQAMERQGHYDTKVSVEQLLRNTYESRRIEQLPQDSQLAIVRICRATYALRSKRGIVHKGAIDPNRSDLLMIFHGAQWILSELVRVSVGLDMDEAVEAVRSLEHDPIPTIEETARAPLVLDGTVRAQDETLLMIAYQMPEGVSQRELTEQMDRRSKSTVSRCIKRLWDARSVERVNGVLVATAKGLAEARQLVAELESD